MRNKSLASRTGAILLALFSFLPLTAYADIEITLKNTFIEKFKNRATIDTTFTVDKAHHQANSPKKDGDLHAAGRAPEIGLASVAVPAPASDRTPAGGATPAARPDSEVIDALTRFLAERSGGIADTGACAFTADVKVFCAALTRTECDQLSGAWHAGKTCSDR